MTSSGRPPCSSSSSSSQGPQEAASYGQSPKGQGQSDRLPWPWSVTFCHLPVTFSVVWRKGGRAEGACLSPGTAAAAYHKLGGLEQQKFMGSQFWGLEV